MNEFSEEEILGQLALSCYRAGGVRKWATVHNCSNSTVSRILKGEMPLTPGIAKVLGIVVKEVVYVKIGDPEPTGNEIRAFVAKESRNEKRRADYKAKKSLR